MILYRTEAGPVVQHDDRCFAVVRDWNELVNDDTLHENLVTQYLTLPDDQALAEHLRRPLAPIVDQELWAAGVTYYRSRTARMEESKNAGGGNFYDLVYAAERPEIFFKATPHRVVGPGEPLHLRSDSRWIVPEPELVLVVTRQGAIVGYTVGNDLSCRDLEGENPLYLPQAKTFDRCAAVGPGVLVSPTPPGPETTIRLTIRRAGHVLCEDATTLAQMKRTPEELVHFLFRDNCHPHGCLLMTGTGIVPPDDLTLQPGDVVAISIDGIGTLVNSMQSDG